MKHVSSIALMGAVCLFSSCDHEERMVARPTFAVDQSISEPRWPEADFTPWMSRAELQYLQNTGPSDQYFAHVEGRNSAGRLEYRAVVMPFTGEQYEQWAVFWGIDEEELFKCEMNLLASGFVRQDTHVFADPTGRSVHQIVWLKPKTPVGDQEQNPVAEAVPPLPAAAPPQAVPDPVAPTSHDDTVKKTVVTEAPVARPVIESPKTTDADSEVSTAPASEISKSQVYIVRQGDTLGKIAKSRKASVAELKTLNHLKSDVLRIGQKLKIPVSGE
jgi:LysM repeat protein